jgi:predicted transposase/invertase (TIGR01784 family)
MIMTTAEKLIKQGKQEGLEEGEQRGEKKAKLEDSRRMLAKGFPIEDICEITGLSRNEVEKLR